MLFTSACSKVGANLEDPFASNKPKVEEVNRTDAKSLSETESEDDSLEKIWERAIKYWPHTRLEDGKQYLMEQADLGNTAAFALKAERDRKRAERNL